jgi:hypothetical protein
MQPVAQLAILAGAAPRLAATAGATLEGPARAWAKMAFVNLRAPLARCRPPRGAPGAACVSSSSSPREGPMAGANIGTLRGARARDRGKARRLGEAGEAGEADWKGKPRPARQAASSSVAASAVSSPA